MKLVTKQKQSAEVAAFADREALLRFLHEALARELACVVRYRRHHFMAQGLAAKRIAQEFLLHSDEELAHADLIAERIVQLGGDPDFTPGAPRACSHSERAPANSIIEMVRENLLAERIAIDSYRELLEYVGEDDPTTRRMLEGMLGVAEAHADELQDLLPGARSA